MAKIWVPMNTGLERAIDTCNRCLDEHQRSDDDLAATAQACAIAHEGESEDRYSLGVYAGHYCDRHWAESGYRDAPASAFDPDDAGETY